MSIIAGTAIESALGGYKIERSLRFNAADNAYLSRTPSSASNRKTWTYSFWVKRAGLARQTLFVANGTDISIPNGQAIYIYGNAGAAFLQTNAVYRDASAWYHFVFAVDTTQSTDTNRLKIYVNGIQETSFSVATYPAQNTDLGINSASVHYIGNNDSRTDCYMTEIRLIDGQALDPTSFGEFNPDTGVWQPIKYTGTYGTNGFYLNFADNSSTTALGYDAAGSNDWTPNNFSVTAGSGNDSLVDTPTPYGTDTGAGGEVRGNYATLNPLNKGSAITLSNGNLDLTQTATWNGVTGTTGVSSGKWYFEFNYGGNNSGGGAVVGVATLTYDITTEPGVDSTVWRYREDGTKRNGGGSSTSYGATWTAGDVIGVAYDMDAGTIVFYKNGSSQGTAFSNLAGNTVVPVVGIYNSLAASSLNFGQRPFAYAAPTGFKALCTQNLPEPTVVDGGDYFNTVLYTGDGNNTRSITGVGFQPDWVWLKRRSSAQNHRVFDVLRGPTNGLYPNLTDEENSAQDANGVLSSFDSDGFSTINGALGVNAVNANGETYVAWNWKANGAGSSNTAGTITSTVSANQTAGFSTVTWTATSGAQTVGHGLGSAPSLIIQKSRSNADDWIVYHASVGSGKYLVLNSTAASATYSTIWDGITSSVLPSDTATNATAGRTYVAYCFAPVEGYSAFGSYTGNGSADGPFVYTEFRVAYLLVKRTDSADGWQIHDDKREPYNPSDQTLYANSSAAEDTGNNTDLLSNGFKIRNTYGTQNASGGTYIYAAFAENPFKYALAR